MAWRRVINSVKSNRTALAEYSAILQGLQIAGTCLLAGALCIIAVFAGKPRSASPTLEEPRLTAPTTRPRVAGNEAATSGPTSQLPLKRNRQVAIGQRKPSYNIPRPSPSTDQAVLLVSALSNNDQHEYSRLIFQLRSRPETAKAALWRAHTLRPDSVDILRDYTIMCGLVFDATTDMGTRRAANVDLISGLEQLKSTMIERSSHLDHLRDVEEALNSARRRQFS
jgi:hypothetical protein